MKKNMKQLEYENSQLLRFRVAHFNECSHFLLLHANAVRDAGIYRSKIKNYFGSWERGSRLQTEIAPVVYHGVSTESHCPGFETVYAGTAINLSEVEIAEFAATIVVTGSRMRVTLVEGLFHRFRATPIVVSHFRNLVVVTLVIDQWRDVASD